MGLHMAVRGLASAGGVFPPWREGQASWGRSRHDGRRALGAAAIGLALWLVAGCGGGGLDADLRASLARSGITPLDTGPAQPPERVALGRALMFDKELSGNRDTACATCHHPLHHTADARSLPAGTGSMGLGPGRTRGPGRPIVPRNAPEAFNRGAPEWTSMFWDSRVRGSPATGFVTPAGAALPNGLTSVLAAQAMFPVTSPAEMRGNPGDTDVFGAVNELANIPDDDLQGIWGGIMARLLAIPEYVSLFQSAYPSVPLGELGFQHAANAIGAFEIAAWTKMDSPWDRYVAGDDTALGDAAKQGALLFYGRAGCSNCHRGNLFTDQLHHNVAVPQVGPGAGAAAPDDLGLGARTGQALDNYKFRTPPLRNVELTGPWMHDGAYTTLVAAVRHMANPEWGIRNYDPRQLDAELMGMVHNDAAAQARILANLDPLVAKPAPLTEAEIDLLVKFLESLTAPSSRDQSAEIPATVPSGLPVDR